MKIGIGGSAANPPHIGHRMLLESLIKSGIFDRIVWLPSGLRKDKNFIAPEHRVNMTKLTLANIGEKSSETKFEILFDDVYDDNHSTMWWLEKFQKENPKDEIIWYTGADSVVPQEKFGGKCEIEAAWDRGEKLMREWKFLIISRKSFPNPKDIKLPKQFEVFNTEEIPGISSSELRKLIAGGKPFEHLVTEEVADYIKGNQLYGWKGKK